VCPGIRRRKARISAVPPLTTCTSGAVVTGVDRIVIDPEIRGGAPCVTASRIPVTTILELLWDGQSPAEVIALYPQLVIDDLRACVDYATRDIDQQSLDQLRPALPGK
jgi:uncharacterized protein (DUF433 family)